MENNSQFDSFELQLTNQAQAFLKETAKWTTFLSIIGFICLAFGVLLGIFYIAMSSVLFSAPGMPAQMQYFGPALGVIMIIISIIFIFPLLYLLRFSSKTKEALNESNTAKLTEAFENHKSFFKFIGIYTIIVLSVYALFIVFAIIAGIASAI